MPMSVAAGSAGSKRAQKIPLRMKLPLVFCLEILELQGKKARFAKRAFAGRPRNRSGLSPPSSPRSSTAARRRRSNAGRPVCGRARDATNSMKAMRRRCRSPAGRHVQHGRALGAARPVLASHVLVGGKAEPSACEPVRMSCRFGLSPRPLLISPFSVRRSAW